MFSTLPEVTISITNADARGFSGNCSGYEGGKRLGYDGNTALSMFENVCVT